MTHHAQPRIRIRPTRTDATRSAAARERTIARRTARQLKRQWSDGSLSNVR